MFDLIFDAVSAWNQIGLLFMGSVFMLIGGGIVVYELYWRTKATWVKARISGIRVTSKKKNQVLNEIKSDKIAVEKKEEKPKESLAESFKKEPVSTLFGSLFALLFISFPFIFAGFGVYTGYQYYDLTGSGVYSEAKVVRIESHYDSDNGTTRNSVLEFRDLSGRSWEVEDRISYGSSASYPVGERIGVYYDADDPESFVIDDFWHNMAISIMFVLIGFGIVFVVFFVSFLQKKQKNKKATVQLESKKSFVGEVYYPVFEYRLPNGETMETVGDMGRSGLAGMLPGSRVTLLIFLNNLNKVRRPSIVLPVFGLVFFIPGVFIMWQALTAFEFNYMVIVLFLAGVGFIAFKISKVVKKIGWDEIKEGWKTMKSEKVEVRSSTCSRKGDKGTLLEIPEIKERLRYVAKNARIACFIFVFIGIGLGGGAYYTGLDMVAKVQGWDSVQGKVVDFRSRYNSSSDGSGNTYYSVVEYKESGQKIRFEDSVGSSHRLHKRGAQVDVLYDPRNPDAAIIDRGVFNWGVSVCLALGAFFIFWIALHNFKIMRRHGGERYRSRV